MATHARLSWSRVLLLILDLGAAALWCRPTFAQPALYSYVTIAGDEGVGSSDGTNADVRFESPSGLAFDPNGSLFITDSGNSTIRKLTAVGTNWVGSTIAGRAGSRGSADGISSDARFSAPFGIAIDGSGNLFVADGSTIRKLTPAGTNWVVSTIAGLAGAYGTTDGTNDGIRFSRPTSVAVNSAGEVFAADSLRLRKLVQQGTNWVSSTIDIPLDIVSWVSFDNSDRLYVAGTYFYGGGEYGLVDLLIQVGTTWTVEPLPIPPDGNYGTFTLTAAPGKRIFVTKNNNTIWQSTLIGTNWIWNQLAGQSGSNNIFGISGSADGTNEAALFRGPVGMAPDTAGNLFVADSGNHEIRKIIPVGNEWVTTTIAGHPPSAASIDGTNQAAHFSSPHGVVVDSGGTIFVADTGAHAIRETDRMGRDWVTHTIAGTLGTQGTTDGTNTNARLHSPSSLALAGPGLLYVSDSGNKTIRRLQRAGTDWVTTTIAGVPDASSSQDGTNGDIRFEAPGDIAADPTGNLYVIDGGTALRKLTAVGTNWVCSTIGLPTGLPWANALASGNGELFLTDASEAVYQITSPASSPVLKRISDYGIADALAVDGTGNLLVADNDFHLIHKTIRLGTTWASYIIGGYFGYAGYDDGTNADARFQGPSAIAVDDAGNLYVTDGNVLRLGTREPVAAPAPVIRGLQNMDGALAFAWSAIPGLNYQVQYSATIDHANWANLEPPLSATNALLSATDTPVQDGQRFYRVVLLP